MVPQSGERSLLCRSTNFLKSRIELSFGFCYTAGVSRESSTSLSPQTSGDPIYTVIPLPPRKPEYEKKRVALPKKPARLSKSRSPKRLSSRERKRRNEFLEAFGIAVGINLLFVFALLFVVIDSSGQREESFFVAKAVEDPESEDDSMKSQKEAAARAAKPPSIDQREVRMKTPPSTVTFTPSFLTSQQDTIPLTIADPTLNLNQSLSQDTFAEVEEQRRERIKEFVESKPTEAPAWAQTGLEGTGVDMGMIGGVFTSERMGDGSKTIVYLDVSGSMNGISRAVETYMKKHFSGAVVRQIRGCSLRQVSAPFPSALLSDPERNERTDFYFVCDLQDGESRRVISALRRFLAAGPNPRRLHIVSFDRPPERNLSGLLSTSGSSLIMARGLGASPEP